MIRGIIGVDLTARTIEFGSSERELVFVAGKASGSQLRTLLFSWLLLLMFFAFIPPSFKSYAQFALAPVVLFLASRLRVEGARVPRVIIILATLGILLGVFAQFSQVRLAKGSFILSTVSERDLQQEAKIYRDRLRKGIGAGGDRLVGLHSGVIKNAESARKILDSSSQLAGIVWGGSRWMNLTLRSYAPLALSSFPKGSVASDLLKARAIPDLYIFRSIPSVGMSHGHERGTLHFLSKIIKIWREIPVSVAPGANSWIFEGEMEALAATQARWTSRSHLALPLWLAANAHLVRAIENPHVKVADLNCAVKQYVEALSLFRTRDNPALELVIRNNLAIAQLVMIDQTPKAVRPLRYVVSNLRKAVSLRSADSAIGSYVALNFYGIRNGNREVKRDVGK